MKQGIINAGVDSCVNLKNHPVNFIIPVIGWGFNRAFKGNLGMKSLGRLGRFLVHMDISMDHQEWLNNRDLPHL